MKDAEIFSYSRARAELDAIVERLESAELDIEAATKDFERGMELINELQAYIKKAQNKVEKIKTKFDQD